MARFTSKGQISINVKNVVQVRNNLGRIQKNIKNGTMEKVDELIEDAKRISQNIIKTETRGSGTLANSLTILYIPKGKNRYNAKLFIPSYVKSPRSNLNYGMLVHEGWRRHPAPVQNNIPFQNWLKKNAPNLLQVGLRQGWLMVGPKEGIHFFDRAFDIVSGKSVNELNKMIKNYI